MRPRELIDYIRHLRSRYRTALLSNALPNLRNLLTDKWRIDDAFHEIIISAEVGLLKPDPAIYTLTLEKLGIESQEAVFIDDNEQNVAGARQVGMRAIRFRNAAQARTDLEVILNEGASKST